MTRPLSHSLAGRVLVCVAAAALVAGIARAQAPAAPDANAPVSRAEYEALKQELIQLRQEMAAQKAAAPAPSQEIEALKKQVADLQKARAAGEAESDERLATIEKNVKAAKEKADANTLGDTKLAVVGDAASGWTSSNHGTNSSFYAGVAPRLLWELNDRLLFDAAFDISVGPNDPPHNNTGKTNFNLTIANLAYTLNDYMVMGSGLFVLPFGQYHNHFDPPWINPLPDDPFVFSDGGLSPGSGLGAFLSGAVPLQLGKVNYAVYVANGPNLETADAGTTGQLHFDNYGDTKNSKAVGGRVGYLPIPELELGYSTLFGRVNPKGFQNTDVVLQAVDASFRKQCATLMGTIHARAEVIWSNVGNATYAPNDPNNPGATLAPFAFNNDRKGGYALLSYRPTLAENTILRNFETVVRYDRMDASSAAPGGGKEHRWTAGLDYWFNPRVVLKLAYERAVMPNTPDANTAVVQVGVGF